MYDYYKLNIPDKYNDVIKEFELKLQKTDVSNKEVRLNFFLNTLFDLNNQFDILCNKNPLHPIFEGDKDENSRDLLKYRFKLSNLLNAYIKLTSTLCLNLQSFDFFLLQYSFDKTPIYEYTYSSPNIPPVLNLRAIDEIDSNKCCTDNVLEISDKYLIDVYNTPGKWDTSDVISHLISLIDDRIFNLFYYALAQYSKIDDIPKDEFNLQETISEYEDSILEYTRGRYKNYAIMTSKYYHNPEIYQLLSQDSVPIHNINTPVNQIGKYRDTLIYTTSNQRCSNFIFGINDTDKRISNLLVIVDHLFVLPSKEFLRDNSLSFRANLLNMDLLKYILFKRAGEERDEYISVSW